MAPPHSSGWVVHPADAASQGGENLQRLDALFAEAGSVETGGASNETRVGKERLQVSTFRQGTRVY